MLDQPARNYTATKVPAPGIAPLLNAFNPATAYMEFLNTSAFKISGEVAQSWLHFLGQRWLNDLRFPQQLAACKTADDFSVAMSEFWQQASKDYSAEFNQIADLTWTAMRTTFEGSAACVSEGSESCCGKCSSKPASTSQERRA